MKKLLFKALDEALPYIWIVICLAVFVTGASMTHYAAYKMAQAVFF
jgi:hypothetical protein